MGGQTKIDCTKNPITAQILDKAKNLSCDLFKNPFFLTMSAMYVFGKLAVNLYMGAKFTTALRSSFVGFILYLLGCYCIYIFTNHCEPEQSSYAKKSYVVIAGLLSRLTYCF